MPFEYGLPEPLEVVGLQVDGLPDLRLRARAVAGAVRVAEHRSKMVVRVDHLVAYCFRDVLSGKLDFLDSAGRQVGEAP